MSRAASLALAGLLALACASAPAPRGLPPAAPDEPFRKAPPPPGPPLVFHAPAPQRFVLSNGLPVALVERRDVPLVEVHLALRTGQDSEPRGKAGLASLALDLLDEGTQGRDAAQVARAFEDLGAHFRAGADADSSSIVLSALSDTLPAALDLFFEVALRPAFRAEDVERVRQQRLSALAQALDDPQAVGQHVLSRVVFGDAHPWAFPAEGTPRSIRALRRSDLVAWHRVNVQPRNAALFVVGDVGAGELRPLLEARLSGWRDRPDRSAPAALPRPPATRTVYLVDKPDAPQSQLWLGELGVDALAPDLFPVRVMNEILGGSFDSRLNGNLRSEHAWSYGAFSFFETHRQPGPFVASAGVSAAHTAEALREILRELARLEAGEVADAELVDAKDALMHSLPALFASDDATAAALARAWAHGLPPDYYGRYPDRVRAVTRADVARAAREHLHPDRMSIVVVGPARRIERELRALGLGRLELRDASGEPLRR